MSDDLEYSALATIDHMVDGDEVLVVREGVPLRFTGTLPTLGEVDELVDAVAAVAANETNINTVATDLQLGATSKIGAVYANIAAVVATGTDLLLGSASKIAAVAADLALGGASLIFRAPQAAIDAAASAISASSSAAGITTANFAAAFKAAIGPTANLRMLADFEGARTAYSGTVTITVASPGVVTWAAHGLSNGDTVVPTTTGALPTGLTAGANLFVVNKATNTFQLSLTSGGAAINTTGTQSGVHTATCPLIVSSIASLNDTPVALSVHSTISSVPNPRPIYTPSRGLSFSSQSGVQNTAVQTITSTANPWAFFGSWDLNVPLLSSTVALETGLAGLGAVEGDMAKVIGDANTTGLGADLLNVLDMNLGDGNLVNGFFKSINGSFAARASVGYLFYYRSADKSKYFAGYIDRRGQLNVVIYPGSGSTVYQLVSKGKVVFPGKLNIAIYNSRARGLTLWCNGVRSYNRDFKACPDITNFTDELLNGSDRTTNATLPISAGFRQFWRGHAFVQSISRRYFQQALTTFMTRHSAPTWLPARETWGFINGGQSHASAYFNISDTWTTAAGYNGSATVPNASYDASLRSPTREAAPNLLTHNCTQPSGGQTLFADTGPFAIRNANAGSPDQPTSHTPTLQGEGYVMGWLKQWNTHVDGPTVDWFMHSFTYPGISLNQLFSEPNTYKPAEYKTANIGLFELLAGLKQQIIIARDEVRANGGVYICKMMQWWHGHADAKITGFTDNASYATQFLAFYDALNTWIKMVCDQTEDLIVIMIPPDYSQTGLVNNTIAQCQRMLDIEATRGTRPIYMGPNESAYTSFIHNDPLGQRGMGECGALAAKRVILDGEPYPAIVPYAYTYTVGGTTIDIDYRVRTGEALAFRDSNGRNILARQTDSGVDTYGYGYFQKSSDVTITIASPGIITWAAHGRANGSLIRLNTLGALPTGLSPGVDYYVVNATTNNFQLALTSGGAAINTSGTQSAVHTAFDVTVKIASVTITSTNRVRVTLASAIVAGSEIQYCGFNCRVGNLASNTAVAGVCLDQDFTTLVSGSPVFAEKAGRFNDLTLIAMSSRKVL